MHNWKEFIAQEEQKEYFINLKKFVEQEREIHKIFPPKEKVFRAFLETNFNNIKVVILGQDPYHAEGQAHGLCFSVEKEVKIPPSLKNIYKELNQNLGIKIPNHGDLSSWAKQGVFLINATLTVQEAKAGSHQNKGWEIFTDNTIEYISKYKENVVFILWGRYARSKKNLIDKNKHLILEASHPSPLSAYNGFFGTEHFSRCNNFLASKNIPIINWNSINEDDFPQKKELFFADFSKIDSFDKQFLDNVFNSDYPVLFPTDTVWGLHTNGYNKKGITEIKRLKNRSDSKQFIVITDSLAKIEKLDIAQKSYNFIMQACLLGPITFVLNCSNNHTMAIRIPQEERLNKLLSKLDYPLVSTSANISNCEMKQKKDELFSIFYNSVHIFNNNDDNINTICSTIVDLTNENELILFREGAVDFNKIEELWKNF